jgi:hypothetical protein
MEQRSVIVVKENKVEGSTIYQIDDYYSDPDSVVRSFLGTLPGLWKGDESRSMNGVYFEDRRHDVYHSDSIRVYDDLAEICGHRAIESGQVITNLTRFKKCEFNNYHDHYWWPHKDAGYTGIIYLNNNPGDRSGTNLYISKDIDNKTGVNEHEFPWRSKEYYEVIHTLEPKYNRLYIFNGNKFTHGMNIVDDMYFGEEYRLNQVFFFTDV